MLKRGLAVKHDSEIRLVRDLRGEMLRNARDHCFFAGLNDSGAELCKANIPYGIAGIHCLQQHLGMEPDATFVSTPDMTITRNAGRWKSGFSYGGKISWGEGNDEVIVLNTKPNACGMFVGGLEELPEIEGLIRKLYDLEAEAMEIDGVEVIWDFYKSNHFIDLFKVEPVTADSFPPYAFIIHSSADEFKADNEFGFGLYYDESEQLNEMAEQIDTPFGGIRYLTGSDAEKYFERYQYVESFAKRKRSLAAELLFEEYVEISNETHQGLINMNEIVLGCHYLKDLETVFPFTLRADLPAYLVRGNPNLSPESIELLGFEKRADRLGVYGRLLNANIIPHGGGYTFPDLLSVNRIIEVNGTRYFEVGMQNDRGKEVISEVRELPYEYRGQTVVLRTLEIGIMEITAKLIPQYALKI